jgi:hypothetical protein
MAWDDFFSKPDALPLVKELELPDFTKSFTEFNKQQGQAAGLQKTATEFNDVSNRAYQEQIFRLAPGLRSAVGDLSENAASLSRGEIPQDVMDQVVNNRAFKNFSSGIGRNSGLGSGLTAADLGLTSLNLIGQGSALTGQTLGYSQALNPSNMTASSLMFSPQQLLQRMDQQAVTNWDVANQNSQIQYMNNQRQSGFDKILGDTVASFVSSPFTFLQNANSLAANSPTMIGNMASNMCGGGGGGAAPMGAGGMSGGLSGGWQGKGFTGGSSFA